MGSNKFYVTTPIYYANSKPHIGTLYSTLLADVCARWNKLQGKDVLFLTGTDEHGQKIHDKAESLKMKPQELVDSMIPFFEVVWKQYELEYDKFIRTTDEDHITAVTAWIKQLQEKGDIYKSEYTGWYCTPCETFVTVQSDDVQKDGEGDYLCPSCNRKLKELSEESYFFRLSAYEDRLLEFYKEHPTFIVPKERMNEVLSFVKSGLRDLCISRKTVKWGIPFPGDAEHTVYVWGDALNNYISAVGYGKNDPLSEDSFNYWWPADVHIMAKDIVRFHAVYWPAFLMAAGLPLPKKLLVHGYILMDNQKMSKSIGNVIDPKQLADWYGVEQVRYYLMRKMAITQDGQFDLKDLEQTIESDLSNSFGNLLNRMLTLSIRNGLSVVEPTESLEADSSVLKDNCEEMFRSYWDNMNHYQFHLALGDVWKFIGEVNAYFHEQKPWVAAKENKELFAEIVSVVCHSLYSVAVLLWPIMPKKMEELLASIGHTVDKKTNYDEELRKSIWNKKFTLKQTDGPLFPRPESHIEEPKEETKDEPVKEIENIKIDDFAKVHLVVGTILEAESMEGSDKLLRLQVDLGDYGKRQVMAGVAKSLKPEELVGKQGIFVGNLPPRKMMGTESQGMMLVTKDDKGKMRMATVDGEVENGTRLS
jgi:methionyl-tRNA synthetase